MADIPQDVHFQKILDKVEQRLLDRLDSQDKAIEKQEKEQQRYNVIHNDLMRRMDEEAKGQMPRNEIEAHLEGKRQDIENLRVRVTTAESTISASRGRDSSVERQKDFTLIYVGMVISILLGLAGVLESILHH